MKEQEFLKRIKRARFAVTSNGNPWLGYSDGNA